MSLVINYIQLIKFILETGIALNNKQVVTNNKYCLTCILFQLLKYKLKYKLAN
jgi:hypothetical protein